jgi:hypothetical protein
MAFGFERATYSNIDRRIQHWLQQGALPDL